MESATKFVLSSIFITGLMTCFQAEAAVSVLNPNQFLNIDFSSLEAPVGSSVPTNTSGTTFSEFRFGNIAVGANPLTGSKAAVFNTTGNLPSYYYDQARLAVDQVQLEYLFKMELVTSGLHQSTNSFGIIFDTPTIQRFDFSPDGLIRARTGSPATGWSNFVLGSYSELSRISFQISANTQTRQWEFTLNGDVLGTGIFASDSGQLNSVRLSLGTLSSLDQPDHRTQVYVDKVYLAVPETSVLGLVSASSLLIFCRRRACDTDK